MTRDLDPERFIHHLIECTMFCDKGTMIRKGKLLADFPALRMKSLFHLAEDIRNMCAHPSGPDSEPPDFAKLKTLIAEGHAFLEKAKSAMAN